MTVQEMIQSMIEEVKISMGNKYPIPRELIFLEGGLHYLTRLQVLCEDSEEPKKAAAVRKSRTRSSEQKPSAREPQTITADHRTTA